MKKLTFTKRALVPMLLMPLMYAALFAAMMALANELEVHRFADLLSGIFAVVAIVQLALFAPYVVFCEFGAIWYSVKALKNGEPKRWNITIILLSIAIAVAATLYWAWFWYCAMGV